MEFNRRALDERPHSSSDQHPPPRYFFEQATIGGYPYGGSRRESEYLKPSDTVGEVFHREYAKDRIRDDFIAHDTQRSVLEDELRRDLAMRKDLIFRERGVDDIGRFRSGMVTKVQDRGISLSEERLLEERIAKTVEEKIGNSLEGRIVMALERSGMVERIAKTVEEKIIDSLEGKIVTGLERSGTVERIARTVEERIGISLERRIPMSLEKFGVAAMKGVGEQPSVPFGAVNAGMKGVGKQPMVPFGAVNVAMKGVGGQPIVPFGAVNAAMKGLGKQPSVPFGAVNVPMKGIEQQPLMPFGAVNVAMKGIGEQPMVPLGAVNVERKVTEVVQAPGHVIKEAKPKPKPKAKAKPNAILADTNAHEGHDIKKATAESSDVAKKKEKDEWSCSLCNIKTTSKRGLDEHLGGKKHQAALIPETKTNNTDNPLPPNKKAKAN